MLRVGVSAGATYLAGMLKTVLPRALAAMAASDGVVATPCTFSLHVVHAVLADSGGACRCEGLPAASGVDQELDVLFLSPIDGGCPDAWEQKCRAAATALVRCCGGNRGGASGAGGGAVSVMWSGETWELTGLREVGVRLLVDTKVPRSRGSSDDGGGSSVAAPPAAFVMPDGVPALYMPVVSVSFSERHAHTPAALLATERDGGKSSEGGESRELRALSVLATKQRFAAYLFSRCDGPGRGRREALFDVLAAAAAEESLGTTPPPSGRVDALGACRGGGRARDERKLASRFDSTSPGGFHDGAVALLAPYKFAVAFEHSPRAPGYVTEKLVNAMLAGALPIYDGPPAAARWFNPASFVDCSEHALLRERSKESGGLDGDDEGSDDVEGWLVRRCVQKVMAVHRNHSAYVEMVSQPWLRCGADGSTAMAARELFGWHPAVDAVDAGISGEAPLREGGFSAAAFPLRLGRALRAALLSSP